MDLQGDVGHVESHFSPFGDCVSVDNVPQAQKLFQTHPMVLLGDKAQVEAHFGLFGDSAYLVARQVLGLH